MYINTKGFAQRDLKPENIFIDRNFDAKVCDFGFIAPLAGRATPQQPQGPGVLTSSVGTARFMAPEVGLQAHY